MKEELIDLYKIIVKVDFDGCRGRMEKHRVKKTKFNYLPTMTTKEMSADGYSYGLGQRVRLSEVMQVSPEFLHSTDHIYRHIFCLEGQKEQALDKLRKDIEEELVKRTKNSTTLLNLWINRKQVDDEPRRKQTAVSLGERKTQSPDCAVEPKA